MTGFESLSGRDKARVYVGFAWRGVVIGIGSMLVGALTGFFVRLLTNIAIGHDLLPEEALATAGWVSFLLGVAVALWFSWIYMVWLFSSRLGGFELRLVEPSIED